MSSNRGHRTMKTIKRSCVLAVALSALLGVTGCDNSNSNSNSNMFVSRFQFEGCSYLVFKKFGDYGNSVLLDPNHQPSTCGSHR